MPFLWRSVTYAALLVLGIPAGFLRNGYCEQSSATCQVSCDESANIFVNLAKKVVPSVVNISTTTTLKSPFVQGSPDDLFRKFFEDFFGQGGGFRWNHRGRRGGPDEPPDEPEDRGENEGSFRKENIKNSDRSLPKAISLGTGFIIDASGLILTNNHVVADADEIRINFTESPEERPVIGTVVGRDVDMDVAIIRAKTDRKMVPLPLGDSDSLQVGEYVMAVGNPFGQGHSATHGIISAKGRFSPDFPLATYLQTDAPINPGNSGGPLVNLKGEVIGINNAIEVRAQGIGFAIPINAFKKTLPQLEKKGTVERGYIGVLVGELTPEIAEKLGLPKDTQAPFITDVVADGPGGQAGLKPYDVILSFNGKAIHSGQDLVSAVISSPVGAMATLEVLRSGKKIESKLKIGKRPNGEVEERKQKKEKRSKTHLDTGMSLETLTPETAHELGIKGKVLGVVVTQVAPDSPAESAGSPEEM